MLEDPYGKPLVQWLVLGDTDSGKNTNVLFHLHVVKSILVQRFVLVFHDIKTVKLKLWHSTFFYVILSKINMGLFTYS